MAFKMFSERTRTYSTSCCCCFHVRTGTIVLGASYIAIHAAITVLLLVFTFHPESFKNYQTSITPIPYNEGRMECDTMFPIGVSLFVMVIGAMMIYGAFTHRSGWLIPFLCYQMFDFAINCFMMLGLLKTLPTLKAHTHLYKNELWDVNTNWLIAFLLLIFGLILVLKAYFMCCVWNCYKYIVNRYTANAQVFSDRNIEQFLPPSYDTAIAIPNKVPPPPYSA